MGKRGHNVPNAEMEPLLNQIKDSLRNASNDAVQRFESQLKEMLEKASEDLNATSEAGLSDKGKKRPRVEPKPMLLKKARNGHRNKSHRRAKDQAHDSTGYSTPCRKKRAKNKVIVDRPEATATFPSINVRQVSPLGVPLIVQSFMPQFIKLPRNVPNIFSSRNLKKVSARYRTIKDYLRVYGWENKLLLKEAEDKVKCSAKRSGSTDLHRHLVSSGIVPQASTKGGSINSDLFVNKQVDGNSNTCDLIRPKVNFKKRMDLVDSIVEAVDICGYSQIAFHVAITLIDKALSWIPRKFSNESWGGHKLKCLAM